MSAPAPGRQRSLGASLLDQVLAETLDPAYARAAAAREEAAARDGGPADGGRPSWLLRHRGRLLVALTLLLAGLLASVTYREAAAGAQGREQTREALRDDIREESEVTDDLVAQLEDLTGQVGRTRDQALAASVTGQRALTRLAAVEQGTAVVAVSGPGLRVTLDDAPPPADSDPVGGATEQNQAGLVQDADVQLAVNGLWAAGAEAISINGQRVGATTAIRQAGGAVLVNFRPVAPPYDIEAVGDSEALTREFLASPEADTLAHLTLDYGLVFDFARVDDLDLPAGTSAELRFAQPLTPSTPAATAPTTDGG